MKNSASARSSLHAWLLIFVFSITLLLAQLSLSGTPLRWPIYSLPLASIALWLLLARSGVLRYDRRHLWALMIFFPVAGMSVLVTPSIHFEFVRDLLIFGGIFLTFLPAFTVTDRMIKVLTMAVGATFLFITIAQQRTSIISVDFLVSKGFAESTLAFPLSLIAIYFVTRRDWLWSLLTLSLSLIAFKRIAILAFLSALAFYYVLQLCNRKNTIGRVGTLTIIITLLTVFILTMTAFNINTLAELFIYTFEIEMSPDQLMLGRYNINNMAMEYLSEQSHINTIFGNGAGAGDIFTRKLTFRLTNMHNDFQKLLFDYGIVGMIAVITAFFIVYSGNRITITIFIYNAILMITDNTIIYYFHQFVSLMVVRALYQQSFEAIPAHFLRRSSQT